MSATASDPTVEATCGDTVDLDPGDVRSLVRSVAATPPLPRRSTTRAPSSPAVRERGSGLELTTHDLDPATGVAHRRRFDEELARQGSDEAMVIVIEVAQLGQLRMLYGAGRTNDLLRVIADRIVGACRSEDLVARVHDGRFAVLFDRIDPSVAHRVSQRLVTAIRAPLPAEIGIPHVMPPPVTATIAMAERFHEFDSAPADLAAAGPPPALRRSRPARPAWAQ